jgi:hypothetical protein
MPWPLIRDDCLIHDKYYRLRGVNTVPLPGPKAISARVTGISMRCRRGSIALEFRACPTRGLLL